ncbi:hypothetical protein AVEN_134407-1 [Araneus ventricosus]|uniref:Mutator-like transposase domain-containing protein n=1 Tax=Araneus ventricosus TaxID=182803 RepID=A0A4Y2L3A9_ARAVE|nr:hypothetical protein AVEN_134407-1 [Araneus ventricosus]
MLKVNAEILRVGEEENGWEKQVLDLSRDVVRGKYIDCDSSLENEEIIDVCVSYDGTWQKRGHTSLHGIGIIIDILTGLVIYFEVLSNMEMNAAMILQKRSMKETKMRCMTLLSDGDGTTHQYLNEIKVYGKNVTIMKEECMNHVAKIVGTGLRNVVQDWKKKSVTLR